MFAAGTVLRELAGEGDLEIVVRDAERTAGHLPSQAHGWAQRSPCRAGRNDRACLEHDCLRAGGVQATGRRAAINSQ